MDKHDIFNAENDRYQIQTRYTLKKSKIKFFIIKCCVFIFLPHSVFMQTY